jgi:Skp family chaperone for outer membrane proteins
MRRTTWFLGIALVAVTALAVTYGIRAQGRNFTPPRIAFVDVGKVLEKYDRVLDSEQAIEKKRLQLRDHFEGRKADLERKVADLDLLSPGSPEYAKQREELEIERARLQWHAKHEEMLLGKSARDEMASIYKQIQDAVERYAKASGLDAVLVVARGDVEGNSIQEVQINIVVRPVLYCTEELDVTKAVTDILNAAYREK